MGGTVRQIVWNPEWKTGSPLIDEQHRRLLGEFNDFIEATQTEVHSQHIANLLDFLGDFLDAHCEEEELQMQATNYPRFPEHKAFHDGMRAKIQSLTAAFRTDPKTVEEETMAFVMDWIENHITIEDKRMAQHLIQFSQKGPLPKP